MYSWSHTNSFGYAVESTAKSLFGDAVRNCHGVTSTLHTQDFVDLRASTTSIHHPIIAAIHLPFATILPSCFVALVALSE